MIRTITVKFSQPTNNAKMKQHLHRWESGITGKRGAGRESVMKYHLPWEYLHFWCLLETDEGLFFGIYMCLHINLVWLLFLCVHVLISLLKCAFLSFQHLTKVCFSFFPTPSSVSSWSTGASGLGKDSIASGPQVSGPQACSHCQCMFACWMCTVER